MREFVFQSRDGAALIRQLQARTFRQGNGATGSSVVFVKYGDGDAGGAEVRQLEKLRGQDDSFWRQFNSLRFDFLKREAFAESNRPRNTVQIRRNQASSSIWPVWGKKSQQVLWSRYAARIPRIYLTSVQLTQLVEQLFAATSLSVPAAHLHSPDCEASSTR